MSALTDLKSQHTLNGIGHVTNGMTASLAMLGFMQPVFTVKTHVMDEGCFKRGVVKIFQDMHGKSLPFKVRYLNRGFIPNVSSTLPAQAITFGSYHALEQYVFSKEYMGTDEGKLSGGLMSGAISSPVTAAFDRVMIIQQKEGGSSLEVSKKIVATEGYRGLVKGLLPTLAREAKFSGGLFALTPIFNQALQRWQEDTEDRSGMTSLGAGIVTGVITTPWDLVKTKMQADRKGLYSSFVGTVRKVVQVEGVSGLFSGGAVRGVLIGGCMFVMNLSKESVPQYFPNAFHQKV
jgi:hypothetical protein